MISSKQTFKAVSDGRASEADKRKNRTFGCQAFRQNIVEEFPVKCDFVTDIFLYCGILRA